LVVHRGRLLAFLSVIVDEAIFENAEKPGFRIGALLKRIRKAERLHVGILHQILRIVLIKGESKSKVVHRIDVGHKLPVKDGRPFLLRIFPSLNFRHSSKVSIAVIYT